MKSYQPFLISGVPLRALFTVLSLLMIAAVLPAQEEEEGPISSRMSLSVTQGDGAALTLNALLRARIDRRYTGLPNLTVVFQDLRDTLGRELGRAETNEDGIATLPLTYDQLNGDTADLYSVAAIFEGNAAFDDSDDDITFTAAKLWLEGYEEDSTRFVTARLTSRGEPVAGEDVVLYVKSMINPMRLGEEETDASGEATFEFPMDLPGNPDGTIDIRAFIEDSDDFANLENWLSKEWGVVRVVESNGPTRALWSTTPPLWMSLIFFAILLFIWGHYLKVIYELFQFRKLTESENQAA